VNEWCNITLVHVPAAPALKNKQLQLHNTQPSESAVMHLYLDGRKVVTMLIVAFVWCSTFDLSHVCIFPSDVVAERALS
jgi:hypothetical protein